MAGRLKPEMADGCFVQGEDCGEAMVIWSELITPTQRLKEFTHLCPFGEWSMN